MSVLLTMMSDEDGLSRECVEGMSGGISLGSN